MEFVFTNEYRSSQVDEIVDYMTGPRLWVPNYDYPDYFDWMQKTWKDLKNERKRAIVAFHGRDIVGVTIYQKHKTKDNYLEIKNLTVRPDKRGRYIASFLLRNAEIEGIRDFRVSHAVADAKESNFEIRSFMLKNNYYVHGQDDLYGLGAGQDVIYRKRLNFSH